MQPLSFAPLSPEFALPGMPGLSAKSESSSTAHRMDLAMMVTLHSHCPLKEPGKQAGQSTTLEIIDVIPAARWLYFIA